MPNNLYILDKTIEEIENNINKINSNLLGNYPIEGYIDQVKKYPEYCSYTFISSDLKTTFEKIKITTNIEALQFYHKLAILNFIKISLDELKKLRFTESILRLYKEWFETVIYDCKNQPNDYYDCNKDFFQKDLSICSLKLIPVGGAWALEKAKIGRRFLFTAGLKQFIKSSKFLLLKMKGFKPFYALHLIDRFIEKFNSSERVKCFIRIADLLEIHNEIRGIYGKSWFYDPEVARISPNLSYVRKSMLENGAEDFKIGSTQFDINNATSKSNIRKNLYCQGKYFPTAYYVIWPRKELITWAKNEKRKKIIL